jgi:hypothetical protein
MASLRKKTEAAIVADPLPVAANPETSPPSPAPVPPSELAATQDDASEALRSQLEALKQAETTQQQAQIAILAAQERRNAWLEATPAAKSHLQELNILHQAALNVGLADTSPEYFDFMSQQLAALDAQRPTTAAQMAGEMQQRAAQARTPEPPPPAPRSNGSFVSAPVSREVPSANGKRNSGRVTLTREEQEMARASGITLEEYAAQKMRLQHLRETGQYSEERR